MSDDKGSSTVGHPLEQRKVIILIVEDQEGVRTAVHDWLCGVFDGLHLINANSGEEAIALSAVEAPDLVLLDIELPHMSGLQTLQRLKALFPQTHVVMFTVHRETCYRLQASEAGATAYVLKHEVGELIAILTELFPSLQRKEHL